MPNLFANAPARQAPASERLLSSFMQQDTRGNIEYLPRGQWSQDTQAEADARSEITSIQREHRVQRRAGQVPQPTPTMSQLVGQPAASFPMQPTPPLNTQAHFRLCLPYDTEAVRGIGLTSMKVY
jgi:hypothetical protein